MNTELDAGFFEPFRGGVQQVNSDGYVEAIIRGKIDFDLDIISQYFDNPSIEHELNERFEQWQTYFRGYAKSDEIRNCLIDCIYAG